MSTITKRHQAAGLFVLGAAVLMMSVVPCFSQGLEAPEVQKMFGTPEQAIEAFIEAIRNDNSEALKEILGPESDEVLSSGDETEDKTVRARFLQLFDEKNQIVKQGEDKAEVVIGEIEWPFPIPIVMENGQWFFDTVSGKEEILDRRIGRNELRTVQTLLAVVDAQREYAITDRDGDGLLEYAQKFRSTPGAKDGLFWKAGEGEEQSPLGPLAAQAQREQYAAKSSEEGPQPYHGYLFRLINRQGANASGGAFDYVVKANMIGGFAVVATPVEYGNSGVMTFIVNYEGVVYQKDLGPETETLAAQIESYDPDGSWQKAPMTID